MLASIRRLLRDPAAVTSYYAFGSTAIGAGMGALFWIIASRYFSPAEVGLGVAFISVATTISAISRLGVDPTLLTYLATASDRRKLIRRAATIAATSGILFALVYLATAHFWTPELAGAVGGIRNTLIFLACIVAWNLSVLLPPIAIALGRSEMLVRVSVVSSAVRLLLPLLLVPILGGFGFMVAFGVGFAALIVLVPRTLRQADAAPVATEDPSARELARYSAVSYIMTLAQVAPLTLVPIIVLRSAGAEQVAYFFVAFTISTVMLMIPQATSASLLARGRAAGGDYTRALRKTVLVTFLFLGPAVLCAILAGDLILAFYGAPYAASSATVLSILAVGTLFGAVTTHLYPTHLRIRGRLRELALFGACQAVVVVVGAAWLTPLHGPLGAALALLGGQLLLALYALARFLPETRGSAAARALDAPLDELAR